MNDGFNTGTAIRGEKMSRTGKRLLLVLILFAIITSSAACAGTGAGSTGSGTMSAGSGSGSAGISGSGTDTDKEKGENAGQTDALPEKTVIRLAYTAGGHVFNAIAQQQGYLDEEGISVEYVPVKTDAEVFRGIKEGTIDVASNSGTNLPLQMISEGMDLTIFGGYLLTGCMPIIAKTETPWTGIEDLIGKKAAFEPNVYAVTGPLLDRGYDPVHDITWLEFEDQADRIKAVESGEADFALVGTDLNYEVNKNPGIKVLAYASDILPDYSCCRVEASSKWVSENPNTVKALLRAWIRAMAYYDAHHDEIVSLMVDVTGREEEFVRAYLDNPRFGLNVDPMRESVRRAWEYMDRLGLLDEEAKRINIDEHVNTALYGEALDECQMKYGKENLKFYEKLQSQFAKNNPIPELEDEQ